MKDDQNNTILIGSTVTFNENVKPKRFIGNFGIVESFGSENIRVRVLGDKFVSYNKNFFYTPPATVRMGEHKIRNPFYDDAKTQEEFLNILDLVFEEAYRAKIITDKQVDELHTYFKTQTGTHVNDSRT